MNRTGRRRLIRAVVLAVAGAAIAVAAGGAVSHSPAAAHHSLADDGVINSKN